MKSDNVNNMKLNLDLKVMQPSSIAPTNIVASKNKSITNLNNGSTPPTTNSNNNNIGVESSNQSVNSQEVEKENAKIYNNLATILNDRDEFKINNISFSYNNDANVFIVYIKDSKSKDVIRQFPTEDFIEKVKNFRNQEKENLNFFLDKSV